MRVSLPLLLLLNLALCTYVSHYLVDCTNSQYQPSLMLRQLELSFGKIVLICI